jgi:hypothetical protein
VVAAVLHRDEETPHLHVVAVPIVQKTLAGRSVPESRLCARDITGGRYRLSRLQDSYHAAVEHLGIERGVKGARIEYEHLHQRYGAMTREPPEVRRLAGAIHVEPPGRFANREEWAAREQERLRAERAPLVTALAARTEELTRALAQEQQRTQALQRDLDDYRAHAARARTLDLGRVVQSLGGVQDRHDPHLWRLAGSTISVDGSRYWDLTSRHEGVGAVDLLMHTTGCDFTKAIAYLAHEGSPEIAAIGAAEYSARDAMRYAERVQDTPVDLRPLREWDRDWDDRGR